MIEPRVFGDDRGFFYESYSERAFAEATAPKVRFVQDNHSRSARNVLRGLHYQLRQPQGKLVRVTAGEIYDVAVDIRRSSPTFGKWTAVVLSAANRKMCWVPPGFAHGFLVTSDYAEVQYKTTRLLRSRARALHRLERPRLGDPLASSGRTRPLPEGSIGTPLEASRVVSVTRILVTGKTGQVGWELQGALAPFGTVIALDRGGMDLASPDSIRRAIRDASPDIIANAAAYAAVDQAESEPDLAMQVNGTARGVMAEEAVSMALSAEILSIALPMPHLRNVTAVS